MKSIKELYRIGTGPSSSHTMAPRRAAERFRARHPEAAAYRVTLYGSLAATGRGHMTDRAILDTLQPSHRSTSCGGRTTSSPSTPTRCASKRSTPPARPPTHGRSTASAAASWPRRGAAAADRGGLRDEHPRRNPRLVPPHGPHLLGIRRGVRAGRHPRLSGRDLAGDARKRRAGTRPRRRAARPAAPRAPRRDLPRARLGLQAEPPVARSGLRLCAGRSRGERLGRTHRDGPDLRLERRGARRALPPSAEPRLLRRAHLPRAGHGRTVRQRRQAQRLDLGRRGGLSGRGGRRLRDGGRSGQPALRAAAPRRSSTPPRWGSSTIWA